MGVVAWILQIVLALAFLAAGGMKLARPRPALVGAGMGWAEDFSDSAVKGIGAVEVLGALGLILPALTGIVGWPWRGAGATTKALIPSSWPALKESLDKSFFL